METDPRVKRYVQDHKKQAVDAYLQEKSGEYMKYVKNLPGGYVNAAAYFIAENYIDFVAFCCQEAMERIKEWDDEERDNALTAEEDEAIHGSDDQ